MTNNDYLTDEELLKLIEDVEDNAMISAPRYMKKTIIGKIESDRQRMKTVNAVMFRLKFAVAVAASIGIFCILPFRMPSQTDRLMSGADIREERFTDYIKEKDDKIVSANEKVDSKIKSKEKREEVLDGFLDLVDIDSIIGRIK